MAPPGPTDWARKLGTRNVLLPGNFGLHFFPSPRPPQPKRGPASKCGGAKMEPTGCLTGWLRSTLGQLEHNKRITNYYYCYHSCHCEWFIVLTTMGEPTDEARQVQSNRAGESLFLRNSQASWFLFITRPDRNTDAKLVATMNQPQATGWIGR